MREPMSAHTICTSHITRSSVRSYLTYIRLLSRRSSALTAARNPPTELKPQILKRPSVTYNWTTTAGPAGAEKKTAGAGATGAAGGG